MLVNPDVAGATVNIPNISIPLGGLSDVSLGSTITDGQALVYRSGAWSNETIQGGGYIGYTAVHSNKQNDNLLGISSVNATNSSSSLSRMVWESANNAWHFYGNIYADGWVAAGGIGSGGGGGSVVEVTQRLSSELQSLTSRLMELRRPYTLLPEAVAEG